jgi:hypothetical protein
LYVITLYSASDWSKYTPRRRAQGGENFVLRRRSLNVFTYEMEYICNS